jgi:hypothetical protein
MDIAEDRYNGTCLQARSAVADDLGRPSESIGESAEDVGGPSDDGANRERCGQIGPGALRTLR